MKKIALLLVGLFAVSYIVQSQNKVSEYVYEDLNRNVVDQPENYQRHIFAPKVVAQNSKTTAGIYANFYMGSEKEKLMYRVNNGSRREMTYVNNYDPEYLNLLHEWDFLEKLIPGKRIPNPVASTHLWRANVPTNLYLGDLVIGEDIKVINAGIGGNTSNDLIDRVEEDVISRKPDLTIIMVGTNDMVNSGKLVPYNTYKNNVINMVKILKQETIEVILVSPPPVDPEYLYTRHSREVFKNESPNQKLDSVKNILVEISSEFNIGFIDVFSEFQKRGLPKHNQDEFIRNLNNSGAKDGVHLTPKGYTFLASLVFDHLLSNNYLERDLKIICFGDSITKGVHVKGSGTSSGETYPAALLKLIKKFKGKN